MSKTNNELGTSYIPPNQLGDAYAFAEQVVFQGISTLSTFQFVESGDFLQMYATSPTLAPLFITETNVQSYPSIQAVLGRTQYMLTSSNTSINSDLNMNGNDILNVNEIQVNDVNLGGHHLTTDANGDLLIDGQPADKEWYKQAVPTGCNITFLSANPLSPINTLYTPNGTDLWYNTTNLTGGGGGGGGEDWATYPANSNVLIPSPYGLSVGANAPIASFPTITLCGNTTIGRASAIPFNAPNVEIYPYNFNVGSDLYPALSIELQSGLGGTTLESLEGISLDALIDVNINAGAVIALDATADINLLALGEISMEALNMNVIVGGVETTAGTILDTATTSIIATAPLVEVNGADFNVLSGATTIESATTAITSGAVVIAGAATASIASPLITLTGAVLGIASATTNLTSVATNITGTNVSVSPTGLLALGNTSGTTTNLSGKFINIFSPNTLSVATSGGVALTNNIPLRVGNITDWNGVLNIRASNVVNDSVSLCNVSYINSVNGTNLNNVNTISQAKRIAFTGNPNQGDIINLSSITAQSDLYINVPSDFIVNAAQVAMTAPTEIDINSQSLLKLESATQLLLNGATTNMNSAITNITATNQVNILAPVVNIPNASHNTNIINCSTINTSTITTAGNIYGGGQIFGAKITGVSIYNQVITLGYTSISAPGNTGNSVATTSGGRLWTRNITIPNGVYQMDITTSITTFAEGVPPTGNQLYFTTTPSTWYIVQIVNPASPYLPVFEDRLVVGDINTIQANAMKTDFVPPSPGTTFYQPVSIPINISYTNYIPGTYQLNIYLYNAALTGINSFLSVSVNMNQLT